LGTVGTLALNFALAPVIRVRARLRARAIIWEFDFRKWYYYGTDVRKQTEI